MSPGGASHLESLNTQSLRLLNTSDCLEVFGRELLRLARRRLSVPDQLHADDLHARARRVRADGSQVDIQRADVLEPTANAEGNFQLRAWNLAPGNREAHKRRAKFVVVSNYFPLNIM